MNNKEILNIGIEHIHSHPENPRKDLGDLSELAKSIKKNGIMQNLTVIPIENQPGEYYALIGNRRHSAAKLAGLKELPCRITEGLSRKEQLSIMLEENMQRNDLTIYEQAQGFQMMLDLGETEDTIAQKTGFSKTTIQHRLNIAKLDADVLKEKEQDDNFQLSLTDLYALEKVKDIETRNKILNEAKNSRDLVWKAQSAIKEAERKKKTDQIIEMLKQMGIEKAPKKASQEIYTSKWETVKEIDLEKDVPKRIQLKKEEDTLYYLPYWRAVRIIKKAKKTKRELTPEELKRKQLYKNKKEIKDEMSKMDARRKEFIENILSGKIAAVKETAEVKDAIWSVLIGSTTSLSLSDFRRFFTGKSDYDCSEEEKNKAQKKVESLSILHQMLLAMHHTMEFIGDIYDYQGIYKENIGNKLKKGYAVLEKYGWSFDDDTSEQILDGTHELYTSE